VNKSDRPEADKLVRELVANVGLNPHDEHSWMIPVCKTEANRDGGVTELLAEIENHQKYLEKSGKKVQKAKAFLREELVDILIESLRASLDSVLKTEGGQDLLDRLYKKELAPYEAAKILSGQAE
jgi:LAO/AO transport system kinase